MQQEPAGIEQIQPIAAGEIRVLTGFSAAGKTFFASRLQKQRPDLLHLVEDAYFHAYRHPAVLGRTLQGLARQALHGTCDPVRAFYAAAQETLFAEALSAAQSGRPVLVDVCCGQPDDFFALLKRQQEAAQKQALPFNIDWVTCAPAVRKARLLQGRATRFDHVLAASPAYLGLVEKIEARLEAQRKAGLPVRLFHNNHGGTHPPKSATSLGGSRTKNLPLLATWGARQHIRLLGG